MLLSLSAIASGSVDAAKGGGKPGGGSGGPASISLDQTDTHLGDTITFTTTGGTWIRIQCHKSIFEPMWGAAASSGSSFVLGGSSSIWTSVGGNVSCVASLYSGSRSNTVLATTGWYSAGAR